MTLQYFLDSLVEEASKGLLKITKDIQEHNGYSDWVIISSLTFTNMICSSKMYRLEDIIHKLTDQDDLIEFEVRVARKSRTKDSYFLLLEFRLDIEK